MLKKMLKIITAFSNLKEETIKPLQVRSDSRVRKLQRNTPQKNKTV